MTSRLGRWRHRGTRGRCKHASAGPETSVGPAPGASRPAHSLRPSLPSLSEAFATLQEILLAGLDGNAASLGAPFDRKAGASCGEKVHEPPKPSFSFSPAVHPSSPQKQSHGRSATLPGRSCPGCPESACQRWRHGFDPWSGETPRAAEQLSPWAKNAGPASRNCCALVLQGLKPQGPRACVPQPEELRQ